MAATLPTDSPLPSLLVWAKEKGIRLDPRLEPGGPEGRSFIAASEPIEPGTAFLVVPRDVLLHADHSVNDEDYAGAFAELSSSSASDPDGIGPLDDRDRLCLLLMIERSRGIQSKWAPYIASLPQRYDDPLWWDPAARLLLKGSRAGAAADAAERALRRLVGLRAKLVEARERDLLEREEEEAAPQAGAGEGGHARRLRRNPLSALRSGSREALEDARWARSAVWSRAFNLPPGGGSGRQRVTLLPVGDMLDHDPLAAVRWSASGPGGEGGTPGVAAGEGDFIFETLGGVPLGSAVSSNYGHKSNEELMVGYGFILQPSNDADFFHFSLGIGGKSGSSGSKRGREADRDAWNRRARLVRLGVPLDAYCTRADPLPRSALVAACAALAGGAAGSALDEVEAPPSNIGVPCPPETQLRAVAALRAALRARAGELGGGAGSASSAEDDDEAGAQRAAEAGDRHREMALLYRAAQRRLAEGAEAALAAAAGRAVGAAALTTAGLFGFSSAAEEGEAEGEEEEVSADGLPPLLFEVGGLCEEKEEGDRSLLVCRPCPSRVAPPSASWTWGVSLSRRGGCRRGQVLAVVPGSEMISVPPAPLFGGSSPGAGGVSSPYSRRRELAAALLCAAARAGLFGSGGGDDEEEERGGGKCGDGGSSRLARRLASAVPLPPSLRLYPSRGSKGDEEKEGSSAAAAAAATAAAAAARSLLERTALADAMVNEAAELSREGARVVVEAAAAAAAAARALSPGLLPEPGSVAAERAGAWALAVVDGSAVPGPTAQLPLVLAPLASAVPRCFRGAAVDFEWVRSSDGGGEKDGDDDREPPSVSSFSLVIRAAADLPGGTEIRRGCALVGQSAFDVAAAAGLEALPALLLLPPLPSSSSGGDPAAAAAAEANTACPGCLGPEEVPVLRPVPAGHGGQAVWHCFETELRLGGLSADSSSSPSSSRKNKKKKKRARKGGDGGAEEDEAPPPTTTALSLARRAADACGLLSSSSSSSSAGVDVFIAVGRPTPKRALAALALSLVARPRSSRRRSSSSKDLSGGSESESESESDTNTDGDEDSEARHEREATAALKQAGIKRLLRTKRAADAAAAAAASSKGAGRDDAAAAALDAGRASDAFLRGVLASPRLGGRTRRALRRSLLGETAALQRCCRCCRLREGETRQREEEEQGAQKEVPTARGMVTGASIYRKGVLAALREHAAALEEK